MEDRILQLENKLKSLSDQCSVENIKNQAITVLKSEIDEVLLGSLTISCIKEEIERRYKRNKSELNDFCKIITNSQNDVKIIIEKINKLFKQVHNTESNVDDILDALKLKANKADVDILDKEIKLLCPISYAKMLTDGVSNSAKISDLLKTQADIQQLLNRIEQDYNQLTALKSDIKGLEINYKSSVEMYITKEEFLRYNTKNNKKFKDSEISVKDLDTKFNFTVEQMKESVETHRKMIFDKVSRQNLDDVIASVSEKLSKSDLIKLQNEFAAKVVNFQNEIAVFNRIQQEQEQVLLQIDETLTEKAHKSDVKNLTQKVANLTKQAEFTDKIDAILNKLDDLSRQSDEKDLQIMRIDREISEMFTFYSRKNNDGQEIRFVKDLLLEIQSDLSHKADRAEILKYLEQKSSYVDHASTGQALDSVHKQLKMLAVQLGAFQRNMNSITPCRGADRIQRDYFAKLTQRLVDYIVNSKPAQEDLPLPEALKTLLRSDNLRISSDFGAPPTPKTRFITPHRKTFSAFDSS